MADLPRSLFRCAKCAGSTSCDSTRLKTRHKSTVQPIAPKKLPSILSTVTMGINAAIVVSTPKNTGIATSVVPLMAASRLSGVKPSWVWIRSPTTMASSTKMPRDSKKPISDKVLMPKSADGKNAMAPRMETGMPAVTHSAKRRRRKSARVSITSNRPPVALLISVDSLETSSSASLLQIRSSSPEGRLRCLTSRNSERSLAIANVLSLPKRHTFSNCVGRPSSMAERSCCSNPSRITAISRRSTRVPSALVMIGMSSNSRPE